MQSEEDGHQPRRRLVKDADRKKTKDKEQARSDRLRKSRFVSALTQIPRIARFLAATYNGQAFQLDLFELRAVDVAISDDMLCCLDALRWGRVDLHTLVPDGDARMRAVIDRWGLRWPQGE